jgi:hypothetical protein
MILFFAAVMVPMIFLLFSISIDLSQLYSERQWAQRVIDEAALVAYRYLPHREQARSAADNYVKILNRLSGTLSSTVSADGVELLYEGTAPFSFAGFAGIDKGLPYQVSSRVRGTVTHGVIALELSQLLAPLVTEAPWGNQTEWPSAELFGHFAPFGSTVSSRHATQQCFNPHLSGVKLAALRVFDYLAAFTKNSLGFSVFPGVFGLIDVYKDAERPGLSLSMPTLALFNTPFGAIQRTSYCLAAMEEERITESYTLPAAHFASGIAANHGDRITDRNTYLVREEALASITVREALWGRAIHPGIVSIRSVLNQIAVTLASGGAQNDFERSNTLAGKPVKMAAIFSADLPREGSERFPSAIVESALRLGLREVLNLFQSEGEALRSLESKGVLYYVMLSTPRRAISNAEAEALQTFFNNVISEMEAQRVFSVRVVLSSNPEDLAAGVIRSLVLENNTAVIDG